MHAELKLVQLVFIHLDAVTVQQFSLRGIRGVRCRASYGGGA